MSTVGKAPSLRAHMWRRSACALFAAALFLALSCSRTYTTVVPAGLAPRYPGAGALDLSAQSIREGVGFVLRAFGDSVGGDELEDLWERNRTYENVEIRSSAEPDIQSLSVAFSLLRDRGFNLFSFQPATPEAIQAVSGLPVIVCALVLHFPRKQVQPLSKADLGVANFALLSLRAPSIAVHIVSSIHPLQEICEIRTHDGLSWECAVQEAIDGLVFAADSPQGHGGYCQIVGHFAVTRLPDFEIEAHITEWFERLPYTYLMPEVKRLH